jgi:CRP-like cAMP-binding protein
MKGSVNIHDTVDQRSTIALGLPGVPRSASTLSTTDARRFKPVKVSYGEGQYFGGAGLFKDARPRPGKELEVFAASRTLLACVNAVNFARLLAVDVALHRSLLYEAKKRLLHSYRAARIPFFCELADTDLQRYAELSELVPVPSRTMIDTASETARGLYVVADGIVSAVLRGSMSSDADTFSLSHGHYFGEFGLMLPSAPISVQYTAGEEEVTLLVLPADAFTYLFGKDRSLLAELRMKIHGKRASLTTVLEHRRARALFMEHLRKGGPSQEGRLHFYEAVTRYLQLEPCGFRAAARAIAEGIVIEYVPDYAVSRVEFSPHLRRDLLQALRDGSTDKYPELLRKAREEIFGELERVSLRPFTHSDAFTHLLAAVAQGSELRELKDELAEFEA